MVQTPPTRATRTAQRSTQRNRLLSPRCSAPLIVVAMLTMLTTLALLLAGCTGAGGAQGLGGTADPTVNCTTHQTVGQIDVIGETLACSVSGAAASETSFTLTYTAISTTGQRRTFDATCAGALHNGAGTCTQTYALIVPFALASSTVTGKLLPDNRAIGPVTPTKS